MNNSIALALLHILNAKYNRTMEMIERLEDEGKITVIRPLRPVEVGRMEKDTAKLAALYQEAYEIALNMLTGNNTRQ